MVIEPVKIIAGSPVGFSFYGMEHKEIGGWIHHPFHLFIWFAPIERDR